jgi:hypothetical protein
MFFANIAVIVVLGLLVWRLGRDRRVEGVPSARWLRIAAVVPLALEGLVFLFFGIGEMASGDLSGAGHLLELLVPVLLAILAWLRPLEGGLALLAAGVLQAVGMLSAIAGVEGAVISPALMILGVPMIVSGALFFIAGLLAQRATHPGTDGGTQSR